MSHGSRNLSNFVIIAQPRCGSNLLSSLLNNHPNIRVIIEPINPSGHRHFLQPAPEKGGILPDSLVHDHLAQAMDILFTRKMPNMLRRRPKSCPVMGFKIMIHQIQALRSEEEFWRILFKDLKLLVILRRNILRQIVSEEICKAGVRTAYWNEDPPRIKVKVPVPRMLSRMREIEAERRYLNHRLHGRVFRQFWYEDIKDNLSKVSNVLPYLGCKQIQLRTRLRQQNAGDLKDLIINYRAVAAALERLNLEQYLES